MHDRVKALQNEPMNYNKFLRINKEAREFIKSGGNNFSARILSVGKLVYDRRYNHHGSKIVLELNYGESEKVAQVEIPFEWVAEKIVRNDFYVTNPSVLRGWGGWKYRTKDLYGYRYSKK